jgi:hypothetical protein
VKKIPVNGGHVMGGPVFWKSDSLGSIIYNWSELDVLLAYRLSGGLLTLPAFAHGTVRSPGHPGGSLTISANGSTTNTGIVWASIPTFEDAKHRGRGNLARFTPRRPEIWTSDMNAERPRGTLVKFRPCRQRQGVSADARQRGGGVRPVIRTSS